MYITHTHTHTCSAHGEASAHTDWMHLHIHTLRGRFIISKMTCVQSSALVIALPCNLISGKLKTDCTGVWSSLPMLQHAQEVAHTRKRANSEMESVQEKIWIFLFPTHHLTVSCFILKAAMSKKKHFKKSVCDLKGQWDTNSYKQQMCSSWNGVIIEGKN